METSHLGRDKVTWLAQRVNETFYPLSIKSAPTVCSSNASTTYSITKTPHQYLGSCPCILSTLDDIPSNCMPTLRYTFGKHSSSRFCSAELHDNVCRGARHATAAWDSRTRTKDLDSLGEEYTDTPYSVSRSKCLEPHRIIGALEVEELTKEPFLTE